MSGKHYLKGKCCRNSLERQRLGEQLKYSHSLGLLALLTCWKGEEIAASCPLRASTQFPWQDSVLTRSMVGIIKTLTGAQ